MMHYDLELIIDREGTEGLLKIYKTMQSDMLGKPLGRLGFLEEDFASDYFNSKISSSLAYLGLASLFEKEVLGYEEDVKTKFMRKESLVNEMNKMIETLMESVKYDGTISENEKRATLQVQAFDHYSDVIVFKHALDLACKKGNAKKLQEPDVAKIIESYASVLKTYASNKKFMRKYLQNQVRILNGQLNETTSNCLEDVLLSYQITDEASLKYFHDIKNKILESKEIPFLSEFEDGKRYGMFYWNKLFMAIGGTPILLAPITTLATVLYALLNNSNVSFSDYVTGGALGVTTYLTVKYYGATIGFLDKLDKKINQKLINKNEDLKKMVIDEKRVF